MLLRIAVLSLLEIGAFAQQRQIAITIDDLPCAGGCKGIAEMQSITDRILTALRGVPAIGFVNEERLQVKGERDARVRLLERWIESGLDLGNHTYSHPDPNRIPLEKYQDDIVHGEVVVRRLMGGDSGKLYFRHPFTHTGPTAEYKAGIERFLASRGYEIAPFTLENSDYAWALAYRRALERNDTAMADRTRREYVAHLKLATAFAEQVSMKMFQREIPQTLLMHANILNAAALPEMLAMFRERGYAFVSLPKALSDKAYSTPDRFVGDDGPSWFERWGIALGIPSPLAGEPEVPKWVRDAYKQASR